MPNLITIVIATHKKYQMPADTMYLPLQVGAVGKESFGFQRDDEGDNISELNPSFCELTGLYWAWKNLHDEYVGLVHYRRHFSMKKKKNAWDSILTFEQIQPYLGTIKIFVPNKRRYYIETLYSHYAHTHYAYQLDITREVISDLYPDFLPSFDIVVNRTWAYMFNMMIMNQELFNEYCTWLFTVLFEVKKRIGNVNTLSNFQNRFFGRISEIIFNVWLNKKIENNEIINTAIKEIPVIHMEKINWWKKGTSFLKAKFLGERYEGSF